MATTNTDIQQQQAKAQQKANLKVVDKAVKKTKPYNDIDLNSWRDYDHIETGTLWNYTSRAKGNGHSFDYHGNFIPQVATQLLTRYTKEDDIVLDMFLGSGTTAIECVNLNRRCIGIELKPDLAKTVEEKIPADKRGERIQVVSGNSASKEINFKIQKSLSELDAEKAQLLILHPPYADIIKFSDNPDCLSNCDDETFVEGFKKVAKNGYDALEKGRYAGLVIGDKYAKGELVPLGFQCMQAMNEVGFKTKSIIVKNIEGNEKAKGRTSNLWRYRALAGGFNIFKHEYVIVFQKK